MTHNTNNPIPQTTTAERSGRIHPGDIVISADGISLLGACCVDRRVLLFPCSMRVCRWGCDGWVLCMSVGLCTCGRPWLHPHYSTLTPKPHDTKQPTGGSSGDGMTREECLALLQQSKRPTRITFLVGAALQERKVSGIG